MLSMPKHQVLSTLRASQEATTCKTDLLKILNHGSMSEIKRVLEQQKTIRNLFDLTTMTVVTSAKNKIVEALTRKVRSLTNQRIRKALIIARLEKMEWQDVEITRAFCTSRHNKWFQKWAKERVRVRVRVWVGFRLALACRFRIVSMCFDIT